MSWETTKDFMQLSAEEVAKLPTSELLALYVGVCVACMGEAPEGADRQAFRRAAAEIDQRMPPRQR